MVVKKTKSVPHDVSPKIAAVLCALLLSAMLVLSGCGGDMLATTQQAKEGEQSASAASAQASAGAAEESAQAAAQASSSAAEPGQIQVTVSIDASNAAAYNSKFKSDLGTFTVNLDADSTVLEALEATGVDYALRGKDYVSSIGGIADKTCGPNSGWEYLVDGKIPLKSANNYVLTGGETIRWAYTVVEGDIEEE